MTPVQIAQIVLNFVLSMLQSASLITPQVTTAINFLIQIAPTVQAEYEDLKQPLQMVLQALEGQADATPEQIALVRSMKTAVDADYDAAYSAYLAKHGVNAT